MSQSPTAADKTSAAEYFRNWDALGIKIARGSSFSGNERNCVFLNTGQERFADVSAATRLDFPDDGRAVALTDWDHDGDMDFWIANRTAPRLRLLRNDIKRDNSFVSLRLRGKTCNRDAIGARVEVVLVGGSSRQLSETARAGSGFLTQSTKWLHFGLLPTEHVAQVRIRWPGDNAWEVISGVNAGARYTVTQGSGRATTTNIPRTELAIKPGRIDSPQSSTQTRVVFSKPIPVPPLVYEDFLGDQQVIEAEPSDIGNATLVNLWASWCQPCLEELAEFSQHKEAISQSGLRIVALSVDGIESTADEERVTKIAAARRVLDRIGFPFKEGVASKEFLSAISSLKSKLIYRERPLPLPSSFLFDARGRLAVLYTGPVEVNQVLQDVQLLDAPQDRLDAEAFPGQGKFVFRSTAVHPLAIADAYIEADYLDDAKRELGDLVARWEGVDDPKLDEESARQRAGVYQRLGAIESRLMNEAAATDAWQKAIALLPSSNSLRMSLASSLGRQGYLAAAREEFNRVLKQSPGQPEIYFSIGARWRELKRPNDAVDAFQKGLQLDPSQAVLRFALASTLLEAGKTAEAIQQYEALIQLKKDAWTARASNNLAWIRATHPDAAFRDGPRAIKLATTACKLTQNKDVKYIGTLGAAYAEAGQFQQAIASTKQAMSMVAKDSNLLGSLRMRLELYEREKPYHEAEN